MSKQEFKKAYAMARKGERYNGWKTPFYQPLCDLGYEKSEIIELLAHKYSPEKENWAYKMLLTQRLPVNKGNKTMSLFGANVRIFNY